MAPLSSDDLLEPASSEAPTRPALIVTREEPVVLLSPPVWTAWQRFVFRYLACHWLLYAFPRPFSLLLDTVAEGFAFLAYRLDAPSLKAVPFSWVRDAQGWLNPRMGPAPGEFWPGAIEAGYQRVTTWVADLGLVPWQVIHQPTGSGDTAHDYTKLFVIGALALLLATGWTLLSRALAYPRLGRWLHLAVRWDLAFWMLSYGFAKFYGGQFGEPSLRNLTTELGDMSPMSEVWKFMGASTPYMWFSGVGEVLGGLLLFHHRTALLGCFVSIAVMANVAALNWLYDVPVKLFSLHLLLYAVFLLAPYRRRLHDVFVGNTLSVPVDMRVARARWAAVLLGVFGCLWVGCHLAATHDQGMKNLEQQKVMRARPNLYGLWEVERMLVDGVEVPATDATRWRFVAIDDRGLTWVRRFDGTDVMFRHTEPSTKEQPFPEQGELVLREFTRGQPQGTPVPEPETWSYARSTKTVKVHEPEPRSFADYEKLVDAERPALVLKGKRGGKEIEVHTVQKRFWLHRGFRFVQEVPVNRPRGM